MPAQTSKRKHPARSGTLPAAPHLARAFDPEGAWRALRDRFLAAIDARLRPAVAERLGDPHFGGLGLRLWLRALAAQGPEVPARLPAALVEVYLRDPEAVPLHDCADCGLAVPVRPTPADDYDAEPERAYFPACPACGGHTGRYAYCSNPARRG